MLNKQEKMKILLITYPVSPYRGSEFSVSWNYIVNMSREHELFVLYGTSGGGLGNVSELKGWLQTHTLDNVHFIDVQMPDNTLSRVLARLRTFNYKLGSFFQYKYWHRQVYHKALEIVKSDGIKIVHYLNPIGFKEPSECWKIKSVAYVWGPVQGVENRPLGLYRALGVSGCVDALIRLIVHNGMLLFSPKIRKAVKRSDCMFAATPNTIRQMKWIFDKDTIYLPENGIQKMNRTEPVMYKKGEKLRIVWCGAVVFRKGLILLLDALCKTKSRQWHLDVIGEGSLFPKLKNYADKQGIGGNITWHRSIPREQVFRLMANSHLHVISSLGDATTTVLLEAMSFAVPTMTLDHCGMAGVVCSKCGIKIPIHSYNQVVSEMAANIDDIIMAPERINSLSRGVIECSKKHLWANRINVFDKVYETVRQKYSN